MLSVSTLRWSRVYQKYRFSMFTTLGFWDKYVTMMNNWMLKSHFYSWWVGGCLFRWGKSSKKDFYFRDSSRVHNLARQQRTMPDIPLGLHKLRVNEVHRVQNWMFIEGLSLSLDCKCIQWKWLLSKMSWRGWVQIINNLAAFPLWHQLAAGN